MRDLSQLLDHRFRVTHLAQKVTLAPRVTHLAQKVTLEETDILRDSSPAVLGQQKDQQNENLPDSLTKKDANHTLV